jgi:hypothetical protein
MGVRYRTDGSVPLRYLGRMHQNATVLRCESDFMRTHMESNSDLLSPLTFAATGSESRHAIYACSIAMGAALHGSGKVTGGSSMTLVANRTSSEVIW